MASPLDNQRASNLRHSVHQRILSQFQDDWATRLNVDQMFVLIDGVLPFEACLYYQVLPLFLEGNQLHLGMVSPDDMAASDYVRRIVSYLNYSLTCHAVSSEALRVALTAYLNHVGSQQTSREAFNSGHYRHTTRKSDRASNPNERLTLVVDSPDDLYGEMDGAEVTASPITAPPSPTAAAGNLTEQTADRSAQPATQPSVSSEAAVSPVVSAEQVPPEQAEVTEPVASPEPSQPRELPQLDAHPLLNSPAPALSPEAQPAATAPVKSLAMLQLQTKHITSPIETLTSLPPQELVQELLARVLLGGIGRLYFECYTQHGRVIWSQNGVLQSVLDPVALPVFQAVIQELKTMACIARLPVTQPQQAELEYLYDRSGVLLRFRFMPGQYGEEATVQVLRGAALKFYQQQQLNKLEHDAITIAKQLQNKLNEIRARAYSQPALLEPKFEMLPKLSQVLHHIEHQLDELGVDTTDS
ncbi:MAG: hypothetical protein IGS54_17010 [Elainella sp. C42_A2020_010]|nr:hypothetical protein [Elainella sp. C42_A2020_010]